MSISVNGQSQVPPGFRFHPTEEELLQYYLRKKVASEEIDLDVIRDVDLNKLEPWDIQEMCKIGSTPQNDWYFFSHKDKKYPTGTRTNRATAVGFWKATGRDKVIYSESRRIGMRKTLVFYKGRAPHGQKSDWIMHEYRLDDIDTNNVCNIVMGEAMQEEGWVVCRVFKKKNLCSNKTYGGSPKSTASPIAAISSSSCDEGTLEQILQSFRQNQQLPLDDINRRFFKLPSLQEEIPNYSSSRAQPLILGETEEIADAGPLYQSESFQDWTALDRLVASHLSGQNDTSKQLSGLNHDDDDDDHDSGMKSTLCCPVDHQLIPLQHQKSLSSSSTRPYGANQDYQNDCDLWNFAPSSNDQLCHMSN